MNRNTTHRLSPRCARRSLFWGQVLIAVELAGCGRSPDVMELPEAARKSVFQKKVDVEQRSSKSPLPRTVPGSPKDRAGSRRP